MDHAYVIVDNACSGSKVWLWLRGCEAVCATPAESVLFRHGNDNNHIQLVSAHSTDQILTSESSIVSNDMCTETASLESGPAPTTWVKDNTKAFALD